MAGLDTSHFFLGGLFPDLVGCKVSCFVLGFRPLPQAPPHRQPLARLRGGHVMWLFFGIRRLYRGLVGGRRVDGAFLIFFLSLMLLFAIFLNGARGLGRVLGPPNSPETDGNRTHTL